MLDDAGPNLDLFKLGFGSKSVRKELKPVHYKTWLETTLLVVLWHLGAEKTMLFAKKDAKTACEWLDGFYLRGHEEKKVTAYWNQITKAQKKKSNEWNRFAGEAQEWIGQVKSSVWREKF